MIKLFTKNQFLKSKSKDLLPLKCIECGNIFYRQKNIIKRRELNPELDIKYCSHKCHNKSRSLKIEAKCGNCDSIFYRIPSSIKSKSGKLFCSSPCAAYYNNAHKTTGNRRSKLEIWIESKLTELYPGLHIDYNKKDAINSELDIYIPSLKLAIELNGIFHYEPIYGEEKLKYIQNNDNRKHQACYEKGIEILSIDTSLMKKFKEDKAKKYITIISEVINNKLF